MPIDTERFAASAGTAFGADPGHHQVDLFGFEVVAVVEMAADPLDKVTLMMVDLAADPTDQMEVVVWVAQFPSRPFVGPQARLPDQIEISEQGEAAVNRRGIDGRVGFVHLTDDLLNGEMPTSAVQHFPHPETGLGESIAPIAEQFCQLPFCFHG